MDTSWSDGTIFAGIEPLQSGHLRIVDTFSQSHGVIFAGIEPLYSGHRSILATFGTFEIVLTND